MNNDVGTIFLYLTIMSTIHAVLSGASIEANSPDTLFLAAKFSDQFGAGPTPAVTIPELCRNLGLPAFRGRKAIRNLTHLKLLSIERQFWTSYPSYRFQLRFDGLTETVMGYTWPHEGRAKQLLLWGEQSPKEHAHQLPIPLRLVLLILFAHATSAGVVDGLGHHTLAKRTGQTPRQIKDQTRKLVRYGYIRQVIEGGNFEGVLGRKTNVYLLNIRHQAFSKARAGGFTGIVNTTRIETPIHDAASTARDHLTPGLAKSQKCNREGARPIINLARAPLRVPEVAQIQWIAALLASELLNQYATDLIPEAPYSLDCPKANLISKPAIRDIHQSSDRLIPNPNKESPDQLPPDSYIELLQAFSCRPSKMDPNEVVLDGDTDRENFKLFLTACAIHRAMLAANALSAIPDLKAGDYHYLIFPAHKSRRWGHFLTIESITTETSSHEPLLYKIRMYPGIPGKPGCEALELLEEEKLEQNTLYGAGLRTLPFEVPRFRQPKINSSR